MAEVEQFCHFYCSWFWNAVVFYKISQWLSWWIF